MSEYPSESKIVVRDAADTEPLKVVLVDQSSDARDAARDAADARLDQELTEGGRVKQFLNGIWKGNIAKEYYRQKYIRQAETTIQESNDLFLGAATPERRAQVVEATIERFQNDDAELYHSAAGERREVRTPQDELSQAIKGLIREYVTHKDVNKLEERKKEVLEEYRAAHGDELLGKGIATADNLVAIAEAVMGRAEHEESLDHTINSIQVVVGEARNGARTEAQYTAVDKVIDKLGKTRIGSLVTPATLATAVAATAAITRFGTQSVAASAAATIAPGVLAGAWAGIRENKRVKDERAQHARERATGGQFEEGDKRRVEMEASRYETKSAVDLISELRGVGSEEALDEGGNDALKAALEALARAQARVTLSDEKSIDLITYTDTTSVGEERMMLDLARRDVRLALESRLDDTARTELNLPVGPDLRAIITHQANSYVSEKLEGDMTAKDKAFAELKARRVRNAVIAGTVVGVAGGLLAQEVASAIDSSRFGLADMINGSAPTLDADGTVHQSILAGAFRGDETVIHTEASSSYDTYTPSAGTESFIDVSDDHTLVENSNGTFNLVDANGEASVEDIVVNDDGSIDASEIDRIEAAGMTVEAKDNTWTETITETKTEQIALADYLERHSDRAEQVSIDKWFNNGTPHSDHNELRMYRGGDGGMIDGGYRFEAGGMTADGSWLGGERVNPLEVAQQGNLVLVISRIGEDAGPMFVVQGGADGGFNIMNDDPASALFTNVNGRAELADGFRASVFVKEGVDENGVIRGGSLATMIGEANIETATDTVETTREVIHHEYEYAITTDGYETTYENTTEVAPITPVVPRRSMEAVKAAEPQSGPEGAYYGGELSSEDAERVRRESSPRLRENPDAELNPKEELEWFHDDLIKRNGAEYVADLDAFVQNDPALKSISAETSSIVTIPVKAVSESENIYSTLSLFAQQEPVNGDKVTILMNVNWYDTHMDDPEKVAAIQKTISEIERARVAFPNLSIAVMQKEYNQAEVESTGGAIGYIAGDLMNAALLAVQSKISSGEMANDHDVLIVRSDADVNGVSRTQLRNFERAADESRDLDIVKGVTRFGVRDHEKFPGFGISTSFINIASIVSSKENAMHTGGANFAVRASTLAAVGGLGKMYKNGKWFTGPGSDDTFVGRRIRAARRMGDTVSGEGYYDSSDGYGYSSSPTDTSDKRRIKVVAGAAIDTNPQRLLPLYVDGVPIMQAWDKTEGGFADGPGGHRNRTEDYAKVESTSKEKADAAEIYKSIEMNITFELRQASKNVATKTLGLFFAGVPGAYTIEGKYGDEKGNEDDPIRFKLTAAGRAFIKNRIERETNGRFGPYGARKMRQLYGQVKPGAKRQPAGSRSPLVSPLT